MSTTEQQATVQLVKEVLADRYLDVRVDHYSFEEHLDTHEATVQCKVTGLPGRPPVEVSGRGVGFVDAVFHAFMAAFAEEYPSLKSIRFAGFEVRADFATRRELAGTDAVARLTLVVQNSRGRRFEFHEESRSLTASAVNATLHATEYFVNTETAFITVHRALQDARARNRSDLVERFSLQLAKLVENTSYSDVIERLRAESEAKG